MDWTIKIIVTLLLIITMIVGRIGLLYLGSNPDVIDSIICSLLLLWVIAILIGNGR